jgi:hypothetical protein
LRRIGFDAALDQDSKMHEGHTFARHHGDDGAVGQGFARVRRELLSEAQGRGNGEQ